MKHGSRIAFLGTGIMGVPMAANLARAGFEVAAWNRTADRTGPLAALGVRCCAQAAEAVSRADIVIVMLSTGPVVDQVLFDGTAESVSSDVVFDPKITRSIHADIRYALWVMDAIDGADNLLTEMGVTPSL